MSVNVGCSGIISPTPPRLNNAGAHEYVVLPAAAAHQTPLVGNVLKVKLVPREELPKSYTAPSQSTVQLFQVLVVLSQTKDPVGAGLPLVTVKLKVPSVIKSAWAYGAHAAKIRAAKKGRTHLDIKSLPLAPRSTQVSIIDAMLKNQPVIQRHGL
jgi:hypothetical protein